MQLRPSPALSRVRVTAAVAGLSLGAATLVGLSGAGAPSAKAPATTEPRTTAAAAKYRVTLYLPTTASTAKRTIKVTFSPKKPTRIQLQHKRNGTFVTWKTKKAPKGSSTTFTYDPPNGRTTTTRMRVIATWKNGRAITPGRTTTWRPAPAPTAPANPKPPTAPVGVLDANGDPTVNLGEPASLNACWSYGPNDARCVNAAVGAINAGRTREGLRGFTLPSNWYSLSRADQFLVVTNDERAVRGLRAIARVSTAMNAIALTGAVTNSDPLLVGWTVEGNRQAYGWASNWAITPGGPLYSHYLWMYDDGLGSGNIDCTPTRTSGCWGHRHNVLAFGAAESSTSLILGAAEATTQYSGWTGLSDATILVKIAN